MKPIAVGAAVRCSVSDSYLLFVYKSVNKCNLRNVKYEEWLNLKHEVFYGRAKLTQMKEKRDFANRHSKRFSADKFRAKSSEMTSSRTEQSQSMTRDQHEVNETTVALPLAGKRATKSSVAETVSGIGVSSRIQLEMGGVSDRSWGCSGDLVPSTMGVSERCRSVPALTTSHRQTQRHIHIQSTLLVVRLRYAI